MSTYSPESDGGYVRLLISDVSEPYMFSDDEISAFLAHNRGPKRAAAQALITIASNEALLAKKITTQDLATDGPAVAEALRKLAAQLRGEADQEDADTGWDMQITRTGRDRHWAPELVERRW